MTLSKATAHNTDEAQQLTQLTLLHQIQWTKVKVEWSDEHSIALTPHHTAEDGARVRLKTLQNMW